MSSVHVVVAEGFADWEPGHALAEIRRSGGIAVRSVGFTAALEQIRNRLADATTDRVIEVLIVAHDRGGSAQPVRSNGLPRV